MPIAVIAILCSVALVARAEETKIVAVLPLDVTNAKLQPADRLAFEEGIRTIAGDALEPLGYTVLTGETTLTVLKNNGIDASKACEASCALEAAQELKAELFVSGSISTTEGEHVAYVRLFSGAGKQLGSVELEGKTIKELRNAFKERSDRLFAKISRGGGQTVTPVPTIDGSGPVVKKGKVTAVVANLTIDARPRDRVRLEITDPTGKALTSGAPYQNPQAAVGTWKVKASASGYSSEAREVVVNADDVKLESIELKALASLVVSGTPEGAAYVISGPGGFKDEGGLPFEASGLPSGTYRVAVSRQGYAKFEQDVPVGPGETKRVAVKLEKEADGGGAGEMVRIPGATFRMGANDGEPDEMPIHSVTLSPFFMDRTEVTVAAYAECVKAGRCSDATDVGDCNWRRAGREKHPINCVDWEQSSAFCLWRGGRLPTEAEWEFAARGSDGRSYPWEEAIPGRQLCWNGPGNDRSESGTCPVGRYPSGASPFGLHDMSGNVWEWVADWYGNYDGSPQRDPKGPVQGSGRVFRGGSWSSNGAASVRTTYRNGYSPSIRNNYVGFRCARDAAP